MIEVTAAIIEKNDRILIARRKRGKEQAGYWEFPGGRIEKNETAENCLERELREELSVETEIVDFIGVSIYEYSDKTIKLIAFTVKIKSGELKIIDHDKFEWILVEDIANYKFSPADIPLIEKYEKYRLQKKD